MIERPLENILFIDHRDSFSGNLVAMLEALSIAAVRLTQIDSPSLPETDDELAELFSQFDALVLSPGPGNPSHYPRSLAVARLWSNDKPLLGVCLGLQIVLSACGCKITRINQNPSHGRQEQLLPLRPSRLLADNEVPDLCVFYNSLGCAIDDPTLGRSCWGVVASAADNIVAIAEHKTAPHLLTQFHPESFATPMGEAVIRAFLRGYA